MKVVAILLILLGVLFTTPAFAQWVESGWYVVTWGGEVVMGPFKSSSACNAWASLLSHFSWRVSPFCQYKWGWGW